MLYSRKYIYLYIANRKTGSTNFQTALIPYADLALVRGMKNSGDFYSHITAEDFFNIFPRDIVGDPFTFSIMRNPFSMVVSHFNYMSRKELQIPLHPLAHLSCRDLNFDQFLSFIEQNTESVPMQSKFLFKADGSKLDSILRLENIVSEMKGIKHLLPNGFDIEACFKKTRKKSINVRMSTSNLTKSHKQCLNDLLAKDLELYESISRYITEENTEDRVRNDNQSSIRFLKWLESNRPIIAAENHCSKALHWRSEGDDRKALEMLEKARDLDPKVAGVSGVIASLYRRLGLNSQWEREAENCANAATSDAITGFEGAYWHFSNRNFKAAYELILNVLRYSEGTTKDFLLLARSATNLSSKEVKNILPILNEAKIKFQMDNKCKKDYEGILDIITKTIATTKLSLSDFDPFSPFIPNIFQLSILQDKGCNKYNQLFREKFDKLILESNELRESDWKEKLHMSKNSRFGIDFWEKNYRRVKTIKCSMYLRLLQYKINRGCLQVEGFQAKHYRSDGLCRFCKNSVETIPHVFWHCNVTQIFLTKVKQFLNIYWPVNIEDLTRLEFIFGIKNESFQSPINFLTLIIKEFIWKKLCSFPESISNPT
ncbi:MAG: hypothetical protein HRU40_22045, partial [Saprospiraceae bacterium]|nr:hypothetical protein [Saprospiraceae bacterium]